MPKILNLYGDEWDRSEDRPGWRSKDAWVGRTDAPIRVLMLSTMIWPELVHYADRGDFGALGERVLLSRPGPMLDYWDGED